MSHQSAEPIFIHSLFRAGSTYLFSVFRRSEAGYWCYQEPLNERLLQIAARPDGFLVGPEGANEKLRHPNMDRPHSYEFHAVADVVREKFQPEFSYRLFFSESEQGMAAVTEYFSGLKQGANGRPLFQCCRTTGRVKALKAAFSGRHLFLLRNPWDQWWSYKNDQYFSSRNLLISAGLDVPPFIQQLKQMIGLPSLLKVSDESAQAYCLNRRLGAQASYVLFYALWCHAVLEAMPHCDLTVDIDELSESPEYRAEMLMKMSEIGLDQLDFSDCQVPRAAYAELDWAFFSRCEDQVHTALQQHGYSEAQLAPLCQQSQRRQLRLVDSKAAGHCAVRDAMRAREHALQVENELSEMQKQVFSARAQLQRLEQRAQSAELKLKQLGASPVKH